MNQKQEFGIIDFNNSVLWLSNLKKKNFFISILKEKFESKNVYSEEDFLKSIKKVEEIRFSALPNLFSQTNTLSKKLTEEKLAAHCFSYFS